MDYEFYIILFSSIILGIININIFHKYFKEKNIIDRINKRSSHQSIATRTGGISIYIVITLITSYYYISGNQIFDFSILIPLTILFLVGIYDDVYDSDFKLKFIFQLIAAKIMIDQGIIINDFNGLFGINEIPYVIAQPLTILFIISTINSFNFVDGIDGLALFEFIKFSLIIFFLTNSVSFSYNVILMIALIISLTLLYYNFRKKNKVFLGDSGSLFLGGVIAIVIISFINSPGNNYNVISSVLVVYLYPIVDLVRIFCLRILNGQSPFIADKNHIHHVLIQKGIIHSRASLIICLSFLIIQLIILNLTT